MMKKGVAILFLLAFMAGFSVPGVHASDEVKMLKEQLETMNKNIQKLQEKILEIEKKNAEEIEEVEYLNDRMDKAELHTATDKLSLGIELRSRADTLHYSDMQAAPAALVNGFSPRMHPGDSTMPVYRRSSSASRIWPWQA